MAAALALLAMPAVTWSQASGGATIEQRLARCVAVSDSRIRLACFDELAGAVLPPATATRTPAVDLASPQPAAPVPTAEATVTADEPARLEPYEEAGELTVSVQQIRKDAVGRWLFFLDNGQVWRQVEKKRVAVPKKFPAQATISAGFLRSTNLKFGEKSRAIKVTRLE